MNWLIGLVVRRAIGKKILGALGWVHERLDGKKSEIVLGIMALVHFLKLIGVLPVEAAAKIEEVLIPILPVVLADRVSKVMKTVDKVVPRQ